MAKTKPTHIRIPYNLREEIFKLAAARETTATAIILDAVRKTIAESQEAEAV